MFVFWLKSESGFSPAFDYKNGGPLTWGKRKRAQRRHQNPIFKRHTLLKSRRWKRNPRSIMKMGPQKREVGNPKWSWLLGTTQRTNGIINKRRTHYQNQMSLRFYQMPSHVHQEDKMQFSAETQNQILTCLWEQQDFKTKQIDLAHSTTWSVMTQSRAIIHYTILTFTATLPVIFMLYGWHGFSHKLAVTSSLYLGIWNLSFVWMEINANAEALEGWGACFWL